MRYEIPEVTALTPAIDAIQSTAPSKGMSYSEGPQPGKDATSAYEDWE
jgi:hypothetical protein